MEICTSCGGSGIQRVSQQQSRTCQTCLGRGVITSIESARQPLDLTGVAGLEAGVSLRDVPAAINAAAASSSAAR